MMMMVVVMMMTKQVMQCRVCHTEWLHTLSLSLDLTATTLLKSICVRVNMEQCQHCQLTCHVHSAATLPLCPRILNAKSLRANIDMEHLKHKHGEKCIIMICPCNESQKQNTQHDKQHDKNVSRSRGWHVKAQAYAYIYIYIHTDIREVLKMPWRRSTFHPSADASRALAVGSSRKQCVKHGQTQRPVKRINVTSNMVKPVASARAWSDSEAVPDPELISDSEPASSSCWLHSALWASQVQSTKRPCYVLGGAQPEHAQKLLSICLTSWRSMCTKTSPMRCSITLSQLHRRRTATAMLKAAVRHALRRWPWCEWVVCHLCVTLFSIVSL